MAEAAEHLGKTISDIVRGRNVVVEVSKEILEECGIAVDSLAYVDWLSRFDLRAIRGAYRISFFRGSR